jgi:hypothetical protein
MLKYKKINHWDVYGTPVGECRTLSSEKQFRITCKGLPVFLSNVLPAVLQHFQM